MTSENLLGVGLYTVPQAARLIGMQTQTLRRWADGYPYASDKANRRTEPLLQRELLTIEGEAVISFHDLLELALIKMFRREGVSLQTIRAAARNAAKLFDSAHPFTIHRFQTDGKRIFATLKEQGVEGLSANALLQDLARSQMVIESIARPFFRQIEYDGLEPLRWFPQGKEGRVVLDPNRSFGKPIDAATGVPTDILYTMVRNGETPERVADWYRVDVESVHSAVAYEHELRAA